MIEPYWGYQRLRFGYWMTQCPVCKRYAKVGDGPEGLLEKHSRLARRPWTDDPWIDCEVKDINIMQARALANFETG